MGLCNSKPSPSPSVSGRKDEVVAQHNDQAAVAAIAVNGETPRNRREEMEAGKKSPFFPFYSPSPNPLDKKSFSLICRSFYEIESRHRKALKPLRAEHLTTVLKRYPHLEHLDLSLCPRITYNSLTIISAL